jgi:arylsulfatase A-like enzyme
LLKKSAGYDDDSLKMNSKLQMAFCLGMFLTVLSVSRFTAASTADHPNVLLIVVDDLRPNLGCYGYRAAATPSIDRLAKSGLLFRRAYCQISSCSPSRSSFLTGLRPDTVGVYDNSKHFRNAVPNATTLPQYFKNHNYHTRSLGKVFHGEYQHEIRDDRPSWSEPAWRPIATQYLTPPSVEILRQRYPKYFDGVRPIAELMNLRRFKGPAWEAPAAEDVELTDGRTAEKAVAVLHELKSLNQPFFLAVGFVKPHAPFVAPARYFKSNDRSDTMLPEQRALPDGAPAIASTSREIYEYHGVPQDEPLADDLTRELCVAYDACVSYVDAQIGRILNELERLELREKTIVVFLSDHGYHLGDVGQWCKNTNFEEALRVPLIVSVPRATHTAGQTTKGIVELVDLYPTLAALCGLPEPKGLEGTSFCALLDAPQLPGKLAAFGQHTSNLRDPAAPVGHSVATAEFRYTCWQTPQDNIVAEELYQIADGRTKSANLVKDARYAETAEHLRTILTKSRKEGASKTTRSNQKTR